ncbi:hypothetical protein HYP85_gp090 [Pseudomonas phage Zuri]|jgi:hypothetical protein|uniref:Uncharacterized protein n=1 Tax=Pseudomonas phage Zuri TaxID=2604899 RepID=A0A5C1K6Z2_9CAUD|nr:hypothetical protein HYP85_gp090 [Pseudomonas phage Zuri]QEM41176.1 hypothetical protein Zuri_83 [Pseudomonas phage Zuri]
MSEVERQLKALDAQLDASRVHVSLRDAVLRLQKNRDFIKVINEQFLVHECARYVHCSADPALDPASRADALAIAQAAGHLKRFLSVMVTMGNHAESQIPDIEREKDDIRSQEADD